MLTRLYLVLFLLFYSNIVFAGQSLVFPNGVGKFTVPGGSPFAQLGDNRIELRVHDWVTPGEGQYQMLFYISNGWQLRLATISGQVYLFVDTMFDVGPNGSAIAISAQGRKDFVVRAQRNVTDKTLTVELWTTGDQPNYTFSVQNFTQCNARSYAGSGEVGSAGLAGTKLAFVKWNSTLVPLNQRPPQSYDSANLGNWQFEGNGTDSSRGMNVTFSGASYTTTPAKPPYAKPRILGAPTWSDWVSLRAGYPAQLDGSISYSQSDSETLTYVWSQLSGPTTVIWANKATPQPTIKGLVFGTYVFSLTVTDSLKNSTSRMLQLGAVATDDNGVVVNADPNIDLLFGPLMAFGKSPWPWLDRVHKNLSEFYGSLLAPEDGVSFQPGTISVTAGSPTIVGTATDLQALFCRNGTITSANNSGYRRHYAYIYPSSGPRVRVKITGCTSATVITMDQPWAGETESGLSYQSAYFEPTWRDLEAGTVSVTNGSNVLTGTDTTFLTTLCGYTELPAIAIRYPSEETPGGYGYQLYNVSSCSSNTAAVIDYAWQLPNMTELSFAVMMQDEVNSRWSGLGTNVNYYDNVAAHYAMYYRSGNNRYQAYARRLADLWLESPANDYFRNITRYQVIGVPRTRGLNGIVQRAVLDGRSDLWPAIRRPLDYDWMNGNGGLQDKRKIGDIREQGYELQHTALGALFDPTLATTYADHLENAVRQIWTPQILADGNWTEGYQDSIRWRQSTASVTHGSSAVTLSAPIFTNGTGTVSTAAGSTSLIGTGTAFNGNWAGYAVQIGSDFYKVGSYVDGTHLTLTTAARASSSSSAYAYTDICGNAQAQTQLLYFGISTADADDANYFCTVSGVNTLTLTDSKFTPVPYSGTTGDAKKWAYDIYSGDGTQPFMMGIVGTAFRFVNKAFIANGRVDQASIAADYSVGVANWLSTKGYRRSAKGLYYKRGGVGNACDPDPEIYAQCLDQGDGPAASREYALETIGAFAAAIEFGFPTTQADIFVGANFGFPGYGGPQTSDGYYAGSLDDRYVPIGKNSKYFGFAFGNGFAATLPAARRGGVQPPNLITTSIGFSLDAIIDAGELRITVTQPSGAQTEIRCPGSPCEVTLDLRQGAHWIQRSYYSSTGTLLSTSEPELIELPIR